MFRKKRRGFFKEEGNAYWRDYETMRRDPIGSFVATIFVKELERVGTRSRIKITDVTLDKTFPQAPFASSMKSLVKENVPKWIDTKAVTWIDER